MLRAKRKFQAIMLELTNVQVTERNCTGGAAHERSLKTAADTAYRLNCFRPGNSSGTRDNLSPSHHTAQRIAIPKPSFRFFDENARAADLLEMNVFVRGFTIGKNIFVELRQIVGRWLPCLPALLLPLTLKL